MPNVVDRSGIRYGRWIARWPVGHKNGQVVWLCSCDCGKLGTVVGGNLASGGSASCGCLKNEVVGALARKLRTRHGHTSKDVGRHTKLYAAFSAAKQRCVNPNTQAYANYGGRGIKFLFDSFEQFHLELGEAPSSEHSLDRIDNNGHYEPGNLRWATRSEQVRNQRPRIRRRSA